MKTIGLIGGTGWVSTVDYYKLINKETNKRLGGLDFARCVLYSLNYGDVDRINQSGDDTAVNELLYHAAQSLQKSGVDFMALCANTAHKYADRLTSRIDLPLVHIGEATANEIQKHGFSKVALMGTMITMENDFYFAKLKEKNIETILPEKEDCEYINKIIFSELFHLEFKEETRQRFLDIIDKLHKKGAEGVVLGCTEIPLLIQQKHTQVSVFNTLEIHAAAIVDFALA